VGAECTGAAALPASNAARLQAQLGTLWQAISMPQILLPAAFIFLWQARQDTLHLRLI